MRFSFEATEAGFDADEGALVCGVTDGERYLTFQRDAENSGEDWGIYLEYGDQINGGYNCVRSCRLSRFALHVDLSQPLGRLEGVEGFDVAFRLHDQSYEALCTGLERVFRGMSEVLHLA
jgi:hypothetical protein